MFSERCRGRNLLNYLKQKGIPFTMEQNLYKSNNLYETDVEEKFKDKEYWKIPCHYYICVMKLLENKEERDLEKNNMWQTTFTFQGKTYNGLGSSKRKSLELTLQNAEKDILINLI
jgi:hypothetical protein